MIEQIEKFVGENIRPSLQAHGGGIELVKLEDKKLYVKLEGGCRGCAGARLTIKNGVERLVRGQFNDVDEVVDLTNHTIH